MEIDIVPFGGVEDENANIAWPPGDEEVLNTSGFKEACDNAEAVRIDNKSNTDIPVATPVGMTLLKLISWMDRSPDLRKKDAKDLAYLMKTYETIAEIQENLYENTELMERYEWDITLAAANLLGRHVKKIAQANTHLQIEALANNKLAKFSTELLAEEMCTHIENEIEHKKQLVTAFFGGYSD